MDPGHVRAVGQCKSTTTTPSASKTHVELTVAEQRITIHNASWDYEGSEPRHGTRVTSLAEKPYYDAAAPSRRQALGLHDPE